MRQSFAITLIVGTLFALWLVNTGRWSRFVSAFMAAYDGTGTGTGTGTGGVFQVTPGSLKPLPPGTPLPQLGGLCPPTRGVTRSYGYCSAQGLGLTQSLMPVPSQQGIPGPGPVIPGTNAQNIALCYAGDYRYCGDALKDVFRYPGDTIKQVVNPLIGWAGIRL